MYAMIRYEGHSEVVLLGNTHLIMVILLYNLNSGHSYQLYDQALHIQYYSHQDLVTIGYQW